MTENTSSSLGNVVTIDDERIKITWTVESGGQWRRR
jgi:hypothetical protein